MQQVIPFGASTLVLSCTFRLSAAGTLLLSTHASSSLSRLSARSLYTQKRSPRVTSAAIHRHQPLAYSTSYLQTYHGILRHTRTDSLTYTRIYRSLSTASNASPDNTATLSASSASSDPPSSSAPTTVSDSTVAVPPATAAVAPLSQRIWNRVKAEALHYWNGTKLLYAEIKIAAGLSWQVLHGHELTRRERKQLTRTSADILRLVPFAVIVIVPFMEFTLPFLLKLFPNMLPSTYLDHKGEEAKLKKNIAAKIEIARFLQDTTTLMAAQLLEKKFPNSAAATSSSSTFTGTTSTTTTPPGDAATDSAASSTTEERNMSVQHFQAIMDKMKHGERVLNEDIVSISRLFDEEFTLDNLNHAQLVAMCRLLEVRVFGSDRVLRYKLHKRMDEIRADDRSIEKEGIDSLSESELREACRARGIHSGESIEYMKRKLADWLQLSLHHDIPISLLILSRAFSTHLTDRQSLAEDLKVTLKHIPDVVVEDAAQKVVELSDDNAAKLAFIKQEQEKQLKEQQATQQAKAAAKAKATTTTTTTPPPAVHADVIGLTEMKEKIEDIKEQNDEVEHDIDETLTVVKQQPITGAAATAAATTTPSTAAAPVSASTPIVVAPKEVEPAVLAKRVKKVDVLNDKVEDLLNRVQQELKQHETQQQQQQQQQQQHQ